MKFLEEKTIIKQVDLNMNFLGKFVMALQSSPQLPIIKFFEDWQKSIGFNNHELYSIVNQGVILTHLYGLIVFPKVVFHNEIPTIKIGEINMEEWGNPNFLSLPGELRKKDKRVLGIDSVSNESELTLEFFIRKLRNSISHNRVSISESMDFVFEDEDGTKVKFDISGVQKFTEKFRSCFSSQKWS